MAARNMMVVGDRLTFWREDGSKAGELFLDESTSPDTIVLRTIHTDGTLNTATSWNTQTGAISLDDDASIETADIADAAVTPVKLGGTVVTTANDGTPAITAALSVLEFQKTANTTTAITMTVTHAGHWVILKMLVGDADSVYTAAVEGGTITFNAAEECALVYCDGTTWRHALLTGATFA